MGSCQFNPRFRTVGKQECEIRAGQNNCLDQLHEDGIILNIEDRAGGSVPWITLTAHWLNPHMPHFSSNSIP